MQNHLWTVSLLASALSILGCEKTGNVDREVEDLKQAEQNAPQVANELQGELAKAKDEVVKLEEKAALAKQGVTDEVVEERNELKEALKTQEQRVREEVNEAQGAAHEHSVDSTKAQQQLERTRATQHVQAEVHTETRTVPTQNEVEVTKQRQNVPVDSTRVVETKRPAAGEVTP